MLKVVRGHDGGETLGEGPDAVGGWRLPTVTSSGRQKVRVKVEPKGGRIKATRGQKVLRQAGDTLRGSKAGLVRQGKV